MYYLVSEYKNIQGKIEISSPVKIYTLDDVVQYVNNKFSFQKVYCTHEEDSNEYFFKSVTDESKLYHVLKIEQK